MKCVPSAFSQTRQQSPAKNEGIWAREGYREALARFVSLLLRGFLGLDCEHLLRDREGWKDTKATSLPCLPENSRVPSSQLCWAEVFRQKAVWSQASQWLIGKAINPNCWKHQATCSLRAATGQSNRGSLRKVLRHCWADVKRETLNVNVLHSSMTFDSSDTTSVQKQPAFWTQLWNPNWESLSCAWCVTLGWLLPRHGKDTGQSNTFSGCSEVQVGIRQEPTLLSSVSHSSL